MNRVSDHDATSQFIANHEKKTYIRGNGMSEAFRTNVKPHVSKWKPTLEFEESTETVVNTRLNKPHEFKCEMECDAHLKIKDAREKNLHKAYAESWERCTTATKGKLEDSTTFESDVCDNPIMLVKAIKENSFSFEESRHEIATIFDALKNHAN